MRKTAIRARKYREHKNNMEKRKNNEKYSDH
jgi:hypothetical protein